jgi:hypothetical protein
MNLRTLHTESTAITGRRPWDVMERYYERVLDYLANQKSEERDMERMKLKYVMTQNGPILFPGSFSHADFKEFTPTSAGFVEIGRDGSVYPYGKSVSLKLQHDSQDEMRIRIAIRGDYL